MTNWNKNAGFGQNIVPMIEEMGPGKIRIVGDSSTVNRQMLADIFGASATDAGFALGGVDADGEPRFYDTIQKGVDACGASAWDKVLVMPGHTETLTAQIDMDKEGMRLIGLGSGSLRPTITVSGAIDGFDVSADNVHIENIGFAVGASATSFINVDSSWCTIKDIYGICDTTSKAVEDAITITANAHDLVIDGVELWDTGATDVNSFLSFEGAATRVTVKNFFAFGNVSTAAIIDAAKVNYLRLENINVSVVGASAQAIVLDSNPEGVALNVYAAGTGGDLAEQADMGNLMRLHRIFITEEIDGSAQGTDQLPAVDS